MTLTLTHAIAGVLVSGIVLLVMAILAFRNARTVHPVRCAHCWNYGHQETVVTYSDQEGHWAICPDCVRYYWKFQESRHDS